MTNNISLYRKYRPKSFIEISGQNAIKKTIKNAVMFNKISHAYLFFGPRGTGKTSIAKIVGKTFNCLSPIDGEACNECLSCKIENNSDIIELDAASNNGVDEIRNIISKVNFVPNNGKYKVYIIDEVHMLSIGAFNALLKTLEEPPPHIIFILATTEIHKIPQTILSRCQCFEFKKISIDDIVKRLEYISNCEQIKIEKQALLEIAYAADGALRDAINLLDQISSYNDEIITENHIYELIGSLTKNNLEYFLGNIKLGNINESLWEIKKYTDTGKNYIKICEEMIRWWKNEILINFDKKDLVDNKKKFEMINMTLKTITKLKDNSDQELIFELLILELININKNLDIGNNDSLKEKEINNNNLNKNEVKEEVIKNIIQTENQTKENEIEKVKEAPIEEKKIEDTTSKYSLKEENIKIRINNCFINPNLKFKNDIIAKISNIPIEIKSKYLKEVELIKDSELMVASDKYLIFVTKYIAGATMFNEYVIKIERMLFEILNIEYKVVAICENEWGKYKQEYMRQKGTYKYIEEIENKEYEMNDLEKLLGKEIVEIKGE